MPLSPSMKLMRSEEHTSELQSQSNLVCRLLLEKKKKKLTRSRARIPAATNQLDLRSAPLLQVEARPARTYPRRRQEPAVFHVSLHYSLAYASIAAVGVVDDVVVDETIREAEAVRDVVVWRASGLAVAEQFDLRAAFVVEFVEAPARGDVDFFFLITRPPPSFPLFPYAPLFR